MKTRNPLPDSLTLHHHPDAIMAEPYFETSLKPAEYESLEGRFSEVQSDDTGVMLKRPGGGCLRLDACAENMIRLRISPEGSSYEDSTTEKLGLIDTDWDKIPFSAESDESAFRFSVAGLEFHLDQHTNDFSFNDRSGNPLVESIRGGFRFSKESSDFSGHRYLASFQFGDEQVFGFGGRNMHPNRTGTSVDIFSEKVGIFRGDYGGCPIPFFISTRGYGFFLNNPWPHVYFDMGRSRKDEWFLQAPGGDCDVFIIHGPEFRDILKTYTGFTGRVPPALRWWMGFWCSSLSFKSSGEILDIAERLRAEDWPCDAVVLDGPWRGGPDFIKQYLTGNEYPSNDMKWHPDFGDGPSMVKSLLEKGIKTCLHLNSRNFRPSTCEEGLKNGLLRQHGEEVVVRVEDEKSEAYYESHLVPRIEDGVGVWWVDHADRVSGEIKPGVPSRNLFGSLWNRLIVKIMDKHGVPNSICLTRGSGIGGQKYGMPWPGDTLVGVDYFEEDIWYCLNAGLAGFSLASVDVGGFKISDKNDAGTPKGWAEVIEVDNVCRRFCQSLFFFPNARIHNNWCNFPRLPWNFPQKFQPLYKRFLEERYQLIPYYYSCALNASKTGEPILRPLVYHHRTDPETYAIGDQFYVGDWMMIAAVTKARVTERHLYLPAGRWVHLWTDRCFKGPGWITVDAPPHDVTGIPVFLKAGAILPRQEKCLHLPDDIPQKLILDIYPNGQSAFDLLESESDENRFSCLKDDQSISFRGTNTTNLNRSYGLRFHRIKSFSTIRLNGEIVDQEDIGFDSKEELLNFSVEAPPCSEFEVIIN